MIVTVTPNPTIDRVVFVRDFQMQDVVRAEREVVWPSGKGIDVSIILHRFGRRTVAIGLNAGHSGQLLASLLDEMNVPHDFIEALGYTRSATLLTDVTTHRQSTVLAHTLRGDETHLQRLLEKVAHYIPESWGLVSAGSIPPGLPPESHAAILNLACDAGLVTLLDSSGEGLRLGASSIPHILKVNAREMAELDAPAIRHWEVMDTRPAIDGIPIDLHWLADYLARQLGKWARQAIITTIGKRGALAVTEEGHYYAPALEVDVVSPAGAGDGVSAGLMLARQQGKSWRDALAMGIATAAAVISNPGTAECSPEEVTALLPQVAVHEL